MAERKVTTEISIDPTKAEAGTKKIAAGLQQVEQAAEKAAAAISGVASGPTSGASNFVQQQLNMLRQQAAAINAGGGAGAVPANKNQPLATAIGGAVAGAIQKNAGRAGGAGGGGASAAAAGAQPGIFAGLQTTFENLQGAIAKIRGLLLGAAAAATGFLAAGNPMLFHTFTGSVQLLGSRISELLIPAFVSVSGAIQNMAHWVNSLDEGTKSAIATVIKWVGGLTLAVVVGAKVVGAIVAIGGAMKAVWGVMAAGFANPIVVAIGAIVLAVGYLTYQLGLLDGVMDRISGRSSIYARPLDQTGTNVQTAINAQLGAPTSQSMARMRNVVTGGSTGSALVGSILGATGLSRLMEGPIGSFFMNSSMAQAIPRIEAELRQQGVDEDQIKARIDAIRSSGLDLSTAEGRTRAAQIAQTNVEGRGIMMASAVQPRQYSSGTEFYNDVLVQAVGRGSLEQRNLQAIQENTQRTFEYLQSLVTGNATPQAAATAASLSNSLVNAGTSFLAAVSGT